jgi:uncharacterized protein YodC (DUF2158 family)
MSDQIKTGDIVQLNPCGPKMIVSSIEIINGERKAWCAWFDGTKKRDGTFSLTSLKSVSQDI